VELEEDLLEESHLEKSEEKLMKAKKSLHLIHSPEHAGWIFDAAHPTQGRRYINAYEKLLSLAKTCDVEIVEATPRIATESELERVHSAYYVDSVLNEGLSSEWEGVRPDMARLASIFAGGTLVALDLLLTGVTPRDLRISSNSIAAARFLGLGRP
jgi:acetoin utilization deacetylase AcuC-like enzyme